MRPIRFLRGFLASGLVVCLITVAGCREETLPSPPSRPPVALASGEVTGVGEVRQGGVSEPDLILRFTETSPTAIMRGQGSFQVTLTDHAGLPDSIRFIGTPAVEGPGSLVAAAALTSPNVLTVTIVDSDPLNIEEMTITGLGIGVLATAAIGPINAVVGGCAGSLAGCTESNVLPSPGEVVPAQ
jgi:hypothetical protein